MDNKLTPDAQGDTLQNILTEAEVEKLLGLTKGQLADLRIKKQLPFLKVSRTARLYLESDLVAWLKGKKTVLNRNEQ